MKDLSDYSDDEIREEYFRREEERKTRHREIIENRHNCRNCAHRFYAKVHQGGITGHYTWVCELKAKQGTGSYNEGPDYSKSYTVCSRTTNLNCPFFLHRKSEEGRKRVEERNMTMAKVISDFIE